MTCASPDEFPAPTCDCPLCAAAFDREYAEPDPAELTPMTPFPYKAKAKSIMVTSTPAETRPFSRFASGGIIRPPHIEEVERTTEREHDPHDPRITTGMSTQILYSDGSIRTYAGTPPPFPHTLTEPDPPPPRHIKARLRAGEFVLTAEDAKRLFDESLSFTFTADNLSETALAALHGTTPPPPPQPALPCGHTTPTLCTDYCFPEPPNPNAPF